MDKMKKIIALISILLITNSAKPQSTDQVSFLDIVNTLVSDSNSVFFYPKLLQKVKEHPNELTESDVQYLYYGQVFQTGYTPRPEFDDYHTDLERFMMNGRKRKVIELGTEILAKYPFDLTTLLYMSECIKEKKLPDTTYFFTKRFRLLLQSILNTGDGKSSLSPIKVIFIWDEYVIKGILGFLGGTEGLGKSDEKHGVICVWNTDKGKIFFEEIYYLPKK